MGRAGVTLADVEKAALQLQGRGKNPSVDAVREVLGTGSKATIAKHLRDFKAQEAQASGKLPQELQALVTGLWERLNAQADERITAIEAASRQTLADLKHELTISQQEQAQLKAQFHQLEEACASERQEKEEAQHQFRQEQQEHAKLSAKYQVLSLQCETAKAENNRLHQLANNIQANLQHYQQAMQQLRTDQALAMEKQQAHFQQEIIGLQQKNALQANKVQAIERESNQKSHELQQAQQQYRVLCQTHDKLTNEYQESARELIIYKERCEQAQQGNKAQAQELANKTKLISELEKQVAINVDHVARLQNSLEQTEDKIEALQQDKLFLTQEKATLEGSLKQFIVFDKG